MTSEHDIQSKIRIDFSKQIPDGLLFRVNVGSGWTGSKIIKNKDGSITILNPRPFNTGVPDGFPDLVGVLPGGKALFVEVKALKGKPSAEQINFISQALKTGACAGVARSIEDVINIINGS
ncbi:VRR-NUC domain-containing protein [Desulfosporosinus fructosivorans]|uniref:VRR-NUC domain-containing protein n=1 Tax=Desulfosporosinus fructosivorans TaxID=2018669 RepID=A0A4Z0QZF5_9FIRM|nr:VRR-NUC domain-containing protein [Desulfosporosinus fructosivorans]TGE35898.1 VRR-NUC domain-containing protein [Desulfosporosinus fructosivorans]